MVTFLLRERYDVFVENSITVDENWVFYDNIQEIERKWCHIYSAGFNVKYRSGYGLVLMNNIIITHLIIRSASFEKDRNS